MRGLMRKVLYFFSLISIFLLSGCPNNEYKEVQESGNAYVHLSNSDCRNLIKNFTMLYDIDYDYGTYLGLFKYTDEDIDFHKDDEIAIALDKCLKKIGISSPDRIKKLLAIENCMSYLKWEEWNSSDSAIERIMEKYEMDENDFNNSESVDMRDVAVVRKFYKDLNPIFYHQPQVVFTDEEFNIFISNYNDIVNGMTNIRWQHFFDGDYEEYDEFLEYYGISGPNRKKKYDEFKNCINYLNDIYSMEHKNIYYPLDTFLSLRHFYYYSGDNMLLIKKYYTILSELE